MWRTKLLATLALWPSLALAQGVQPPIIPPAIANLLPLNNTWTGTNAFTGTVSVGGSNSWINTYLPGSLVTGQVAEFVISPVGGYSAIIYATRGSDNPSGTTQSLIGGISLTVADNTTVSHNYFGHYFETWIPATGIYKQLNGFENSVNNLKANATVATPYNAIYGNTGLVANSKTDVGVGTANSSFEPSAAGLFTNNGGKFPVGLVFGADALDTTSGFAAAMAMGENQGFSWPLNPGQGWRLFMNTGTGNGQVILGDVTGNTGAGEFDIFLGPSSSVTHPLSITGTGIQMADLPTSAGSGGLVVCIDTSGNLYKKSSCP